MGNEIPFRELKAPYDEWKDIVIEEGMNRHPVMVFVEVRNSNVITFLCPENGRIVKRMMTTQKFDEKLDIEHGKELYTFKGVVRRGDVVDVGEGKNFWEPEMRWAVVAEFGNLVWLEEGKEEQVMEALMESAKRGRDTAHEDKLKEMQYLQSDPEFDYLYEKVMGYKPR
ncbi:MAG: hypothetical protein QW292_13730 [Candidatus Parvarchaeota archaeon]